MIQEKTKKLITYFSEMLIIALFTFSMFNSQLYFNLTNTVGTYDNIFGVIRILPRENVDSYFDTALHEYAHYVWDNFDLQIKQSFYDYLGNKTSFINKNNMYSELFAKQVVYSCWMRNTNRRDDSLISQYPNWDSISTTYFGKICEKLQ